jgi:beta-lactamase regulating signal transducer with metallopeptidase domain
METLAPYLLKVSVCLAVFYFLFTCLFSTKTFFSFNRAYLLFALVASMIIPIVTFSSFENPYAFDGVDLSASFLEPENVLLPLQNQSTTKPVSIIGFLEVLYIAGIVFMVARFLIFIYKIIDLRRNGQTVELGQLRVVRTKLSHPFAFFNSIFLPENETSSLILKHERVHVEQFHLIDLLIVEVISIVLWFNPMLILYRRSIRLQHEYLADASTIHSGIPIESYLECLVNEIQAKSFSYPISQFYSNSIKKRINMITKTKMSWPISLVYLLVIPVVCVLLFSFSTRPDVHLPVRAIVIEADDEPSIFPVDMKKAEMVSGYGMRMHPTLKVKRLHTGIDLELAEGEIVVATADGTVIESNSDGKRGIYLLIKHNDTFTTAYFHFKNVVVKRGDKIEKNQTIGYVGSTGLSLFPHLHYEVIKNGKPVDPMDYLPK